MKRKPAKGVRSKKLGLRIKNILSLVLNDNSYFYYPENDKLEQQAIDFLLAYNVIRFVRKKKYKYGWRGKGLWWDSPQVFKLGEF